METKPKIVIIGAGQVGTSVALATAGKFSDNITMFDINPDYIRELNAIVRDRKMDNVIRGIYVAESSKEKYQAFKKELESADLVVVATPISAFGGVVEAVAPLLREGAIITDPGSVKKPAIEAITKALQETGRTDIYYQWSHPGTGNEKAGPSAGNEKMYDGQTVFIGSSGIKVLTGDNREVENYKTLKAFWESQGAKVKILSPQRHDLFMGITSHFQHVLVFSLMALGFDENGQWRDEYKNAGTSLRNTTRVATAGKNMWLPILAGNKEVIISAADGFSSYTKKILTCVETGDETALTKILKEAREFRASLAPKDANNNPPVIRENFFGEIDDFTRQKNGSLTQLDATALLTQQGKQDAFARIALLPYLIGVASTLNAKEKLAGKINMDLPNTANPSFLDGSAPALNDPDYMAKFLIANKAQTLAVARDFLNQLDYVVSKISNSANNNEVYETSIRQLIENANAGRKLMPLPRRLREDMPDKNAAVRPEYAIEIVSSYAVPLADASFDSPASLPAGRGRGIQRWSP